MASSEYGNILEEKLSNAGVNTYNEVKSFRSGARRGGFTLFAIVGQVQEHLGKVWISRKRVRSDALRLFNEGAL